MAEPLPPLVADLKNALQALHDAGWSVTASGLSLLVENGRDMHLIDEPFVYHEQEYGIE